MNKNGAFVIICLVLSKTVLGTDVDMLFHRFTFIPTLTTHITHIMTARNDYDNYEFPTLKQLNDATMQTCIPLLYNEIKCSLAKKQPELPEKFVRDCLFNSYNLKKDEYDFTYDASKSGVITITTKIHYDHPRQCDPCYALEGEKDQLKYVAVRSGLAPYTEDNEYLVSYTIEMSKKCFFEKYYEYDKQQTTTLAQSCKPMDKVASTGATVPVVSTDSSSSKTQTTLPTKQDSTPNITTKEP